MQYRFSGVYDITKSELTTEKIQNVSYFMCLPKVKKNISNCQNPENEILSLSVNIVGQTVCLHKILFFDITKSKVCTKNEERNNFLILLKR